jgi:cytochrome c-type biogenesis protein CcmI
VSGDVLPSLVGIVLVAAAAAFVLLPFARGARAEAAPSENPAADRFGLYRQVLELEFDYQLGKLSKTDFEQLSSELLAQAGEALREERGNLGAIDAEIEREIAAARAAFAAARRVSTREAETVP